MYVHLSFPSFYFNLLDLCDSHYISKFSYKKIQVLHGLARIFSKIKKKRSNFVKEISNYIHYELNFSSKMMR